MADKRSNTGDSEGVRERILAAAREELSNRGLEASSVRTIAENAGVTAAMINYYFGSKRALYDIVVTEAQDRLHTRLGEALADGPSGARLAAAYFDFLAEDRQMQRLLLRDVLDGHGERILDLVGPLGVLLEEHFGRTAAVQSALSMFGAIVGYFIYEPVLGELLGEEPVSAVALARRREHIIKLASAIEELNE